MPYIIIENGNEMVACFVPQIRVAIVIGMKYGSGFLSQTFLCERSSSVLQTCQGKTI